MLIFDTALQEQLIYAVLDEFTPESVVPQSHENEYDKTPILWREDVVEFITVMLKAGLIAPVGGEDGYADSSFEEIINMLRFGDPENGFDTESFWCVIQFFGTEKLRKLMGDLGLASWDKLHTELSPALKDALVEMGVVAR